MNRILDAPQIATIIMEGSDYEKGKDEARAFVLFLRKEIARHKLDIENAASLIFEVVNKFHLEGIVDDD